MMIGFGNLNGAVTSNVYRGKDKPWYSLGHGIVLMYIGIGVISTTVFKILLTLENRKRDRGERDEIIKGVNDEKVGISFNLEPYYVAEVGIRRLLWLKMDSSIEVFSKEAKTYMSLLMR